MIQLKTENWKLVKMSEVAEELKKIVGQDYVMVLDIIELYTSCIQLSLYILRKKKSISGRVLLAWYEIVYMTRLYACRLRKIYYKREDCTKNLITWTHSWKKFTFHGWIPSRATISLSQRSDSDRFMIKCCSRASRFWNDRLRTLLPKTDLVCIVFIKDI